LKILVASCGPVVRQVWASLPDLALVEATLKHATTMNMIYDNNGQSIAHEREKFNKSGHRNGRLMTLRRRYEDATTTLKGTSETGGAPS
jgi:hypothetical protein